MLRILDKYNLTYGLLKNHFLNRDKSLIEVSQSGSFSKFYNLGNLNNKIPFDSFIAVRIHNCRIMDLIVLSQTTKVTKFSKS
jgi:hypothetical protein